MQVNGKTFRTLWPKEPRSAVLKIIDQRQLPHEFVIEDLPLLEDTARAITDMHVRGAGLIGAAAAYGMYQAECEGRNLQEAAEYLQQTRPTAVNLAWAVKRMLKAKADGRDLYDEAMTIADEDAQWCKSIGEHGSNIIRKIAATKNPGEPVNILTHCNAGWLAFVDYGSATAPIYKAHEDGIGVHVWVDETRPRNQGSQLTMWELMQHGVPCTLITDNAGGHLMQHGQVDMCIVGSDRTSCGGDVGNKIGTYLKALAANANTVPFYVALPESTIDWECANGEQIPIEERDPSEVLTIAGVDAAGEIGEVNLAAAGSSALNPAFDVTPADLVDALVTEHGVFDASVAGLGKLRDLLD
jgi:methylthioribose-1-phosphate isomerase